MQFVCRIGTPEGRVFEDVFTATDEASLRNDLTKRGYHLFEVRRRGLARGWKLGSLGRGRKKIPMERFLIFNQELAALLRAGLPLLQALDLMLERMEHPEFKAVLVDVRDRVKSGEDLSEAFATYGDMFPRLYPPSLKAGERSGELESVIRRFIRYMRLLLETRKRVITALTYPAVLVGLSISMILMMTVYVIPRFHEFYEGLGGELPLLTRITVGVSTFMRHNILWLAAGAVLLAVAFRSWRDTEKGRAAIDGWKLRVPLLGRIFQRLAMSEFCRSLATLLTGGIPLVPAFEISVEAVGNANIRERIRPTIQMVREGKPFHAALDESGVFTEMAVDMAKVGEATGSLDEMLSSISEFLDEQVDVQLQRILSLLEPMMLVLMGMFIALILISLYLPMFGLLSRANV